MVESIDLGVIKIFRIEDDDLIEITMDDQPLGWIRKEQFQEIVDVVSDRTNLVPLTMVVTALLDEGLDYDHLLNLARISAGTIHFRPNDKTTHRQAREIVGAALGVE